MYCSHCGKKVTDTMLFCPFCGDPIVIPDQDEPDEAGRPSAPAPSAPIEAGASDKPPEGEEEGPFAEEPDERPAEPDAVAEAEAPAPPDDAAAELMDWSRSRREYAEDVWAEREAPLEDFKPLDLETPEEASEDWREDIERRKESAAPREKRPPRMSGTGDPVRLEGVAPKLESGKERAKAAGDGPKKPARKSANTLVPPKTMDPNDIFMDSRHPSPEEYDDYDAFDDGYDAPRIEDERYAYEDEGEGSFFMRHLRGLVGFALFVVLILIFVIYAFSPAGQITLAKVNLASSAAAYEQLGYQSYQEGQYALAGQYYERALQRDPDNYNYASAAVMAYMEVNNSEKAAEMLKRCIEIDPTPLEPYLYLLNLYPDAAQRPWEVTQLLQQGYQLTGNSSLKVTG